jgi:hypothetical protein
MIRVPVVVLLLMGMICLPSAASAASLVLDDPEPVLKQDGDAWKVGVGLTNIGDRPITVTPVSTKPKVAAGDGCEVSLADAKPIPPAQHTDVEVRYGAGCEVPDSGVAFELRTDATPATIGPLSAAPKEDDGDVEWIALVSFLIAWPCGTLMLAIAAANLRVKRNGQDEAVQPTAALANLPATWKFGDSWATNITLLAGVLTSVVGASGVVKAILGEDADQAIALATVGAAVAGVVIGLGAVVLQVFKVVNVEKGTDAFTRRGLVAAGGVTLAGAYGQLWVTYRTGSKLTLGGVEGWLWLPLGAAGILLAVYACRNIRATIRVGATPPEPPAAPDVSALLEALLGHLKLQEGKSKEQVVEAVTAELAEQADVAPAPVPDVHAALL